MRVRGLEPGAIVVIVGEPTAPQRASTVSIHVVGSASAEGSEVPLAVLTETLGAGGICLGDLHDSSSAPGGKGARMNSEAR